MAGKMLAHIVCLLIYPFSFIFPRKKKRYAFGSYRGLFNDNSKYMFIWLSENHPELDICWLSTSKNTVKQVRACGFRARSVFSLKGAWFALTSKLWVVNAYTSDILFCLSGNAMVVNLWHGIGLKRCEFNVTSGPLSDRYVKKTLKERITHPEVYRRPDFLLTVSDFQTPMFARGFRLPESKCLKLGYPRNAIMLCEEAERERFVGKYESEAVREVISKCRSFKKVYIYMPTWRDSQKDIFSEGFDLKTVDSLMKESDSLMILKPHHNTKVDNDALQKYENVMLLEDISDIYPILPYCDVLITDYSSVLYDFILMPGKDVILYLYDYKEYRGLRDFYFPFDENVAGKRVYDFEELRRVISEKDYRIDDAAREAVVSRFWGGSDSLNASGRILNSVNL